MHSSTKAAPTGGEIQRPTVSKSESDSVEQTTLTGEKPENFTVSQPAEQSESEIVSPVQNTPSVSESVGLFNSQEEKLSDGGQPIGGQQLHCTLSPSDEAGGREGFRFIISLNKTAGGNNEIVSPVQPAPYVDLPQGSTASPSEKASDRSETESGPKHDTAKKKEESLLAANINGYICEVYTWTGACPRALHCPRYHSPDRLPYLWFIEEDEQWWSVPITDSIHLEKRFCNLDYFREVKCSGDHCALSATFRGKPAKLRRLSTPSYVTADPETPFRFYTQWMWYRQERGGKYIPFYPGSLQYTLEEKYLKGQHKYYLEFEELSVMVDTHSSPMTQTNLDTQASTRIVRRPVFVSHEQPDAPRISPLLLPEAPKLLLHRVPEHWTAVDRFQNFELVELNSTHPEYVNVHRQFFSTMDVSKHKIVHMFRVQNPGLWDKYCSARRAMTPKDWSPEDVDERQLFHGTPTLQASRGICTNSFDFRRSGENVGAVLGKGAYFSTTAKYSHKFTRVHIPAKGDPTRFMFLGRILVGRYTLGDPSYTKPPERDRLKMYDSCVNDLSNPSIFVIFDLAQSYPEYLIQYTDVSDLVQPRTSPAVSVPPQQQPSSSSKRANNESSNICIIL